MSGWICPKCGYNEEPEWNWEHIQGDEAIRVPTCPDCGTEMVDSAPCPICGEEMELGKPFCFNCYTFLMNRLEWDVDEIALPGTTKRAKWDAIYDIAQIMCDRIWREEAKR